MTQSISYFGFDLLNIPLYFDNPTPKPDGMLYVAGPGGGNALTGLNPYFPMVFLRLDFRFAFDFLFFCIAAEICLSSTTFNDSKWIPEPRKEIRSDTSLYARLFLLSALRVLPLCFFVAFCAARFFRKRGTLFLDTLSMVLLF